MRKRLVQVEENFSDEGEKFEPNFMVAQTQSYAVNMMSKT